jgi:DNA-directed RNA polymerase subunit K/omega
MSSKYYPPEKLLQASEGSIYKLAILVSKRAMLLADGEKPLVEGASEKLLDTALKEICENKITMKDSKKK